MNRRAFLGRSAALAATMLTPIPRAMALVVPDAPPLRWFAVGTDEYLYPYLARSAADAARQFAEEYGCTVGEDCPECGEVACTLHNDDLDAPQPWIAGNGFAFPADLPVDRDPPLSAWIKAGCNVPCEDCDYGEPTECRMFEGRALCDECLEIARIERLDAVVGAPAGTPPRQPRFEVEGLA